MPNSRYRSIQQTLNRKIRVHNPRKSNLGIPPINSTLLPVLLVHKELRLQNERAIAMIPIIANICESSGIPNACILCKLKGRL